MTNKATMLWLAFILFGVAIKAGARPERLGVSIDPRGSDVAASITLKPDQSVSGPRPGASAGSTDHLLDNFDIVMPVIGASAQKNCLYLTLFGRRSVDIETDNLCPFFHVFDN